MFSPFKWKRKHNLLVLLHSIKDIYNNHEEWITKRRANSKANQQPTKSKFYFFRWTIRVGECVFSLREKELSKENSIQSHLFSVLYLQVTRWKKKLEWVKWKGTKKGSIFHFKSSRFSLWIFFLFLLFFFLFSMRTVLLYFKTLIAMDFSPSLFLILLLLLLMLLCLIKSKYNRALIIYISIKLNWCRLTKTGKKTTTKHKMRKENVAANIMNKTQGNFCVLCLHLFFFFFRYF